MNKLIFLLAVSMFVACKGGETPVAPNSSGVGQTPSNKKIRLGYLYADGTGAVNAVDWGRLTHVALFSAFVPQEDGSVYRFASYGNTALTVPWMDGSPFRIKYESELRATGLKTLFVLGGAGDAVTSALKKVCVNPAARANMVQQLAELVNGTLVQQDGSVVKSYGFDGLDVDWEFPVTASDKECFYTMLSELRAALPNKTLSVATSYSTAYYENTATGLTVDRFNQIGVDWIGLMTYDYTQSASQLDHSGYGDGIKWLEFWRGKGIPAQKLLLGMALYGWTVPGQNGVAGKATLPWKDYYALPQWQPYFSSKDSTLLKAQYVVNGDYAGVMYWELGQDAYFTDFSRTAWVDDQLKANGK